MSASIITHNLTKNFRSSKRQKSNILTISELLKGNAITDEVRIEEQAAVKDISLSIHTGERIGIVGRNGAGKTTLLNMLAGLLEPTSGELEVNGEVCAVMTLGIGLREDLTGRENIYIDGDIKGNSKHDIDKIVDDVIEFAELDKFIDMPLRAYSTGMKARLAFSLLVNTSPEILIIDEALSVGDEFFTRKATARMNELCQQGKIVILVSHSTASIVNMCNRCLWMDKGEIIMDGKPAEVTKAYIETVRKQDEKELVEKFYRYADKTKKSHDCEIKDFYASNDDESKSRAIFNTDEKLVMHLSFTLPQQGITGVLLTVMRLDGLIVVKNFLDNEPFFSDSKSSFAAFEIALGKVILGEGIYQASLEIVHDKTTLASKIIIFEVQTLTKPVGGRPTLLYPTYISSRKNMTGENNVRV